MEGNIALLIPILVPLAAFLMVYFINKEENQTKRKMIENGMNPKESDSPGQKYGALKFGGLLIGAGVGLALATVLSDALNLQDRDGLYFGLIALFGGVGLVIAHQVARKQGLQDQGLL